MKKATAQLCYVQNTASEKDNFKLRLTQNQYFILEEAISTTWRTKKCTIFSAVLTIVMSQDNHITPLCY